MKSNIFAPQRPVRFKLIHTLTGQTVAKADSLADFREMIDQADAQYFTLHDLQESEYSGASRIFTDAAQSVNT